MEQQEQVEWDDVNKLLQHHGFKPVCFADPTENNNHSDLVLLDKRSTCEIRATLKTVLTDSERKQALIHELIKSNNQLKEEVQDHMRRAAQQAQRATKLEGLLDLVKTRVQDLEDRYLGKAVQQHRHTQLQEEKQQSLKLCEVLEQKLLKQREETAQLQRKLYFTIKEEERRLSHQSEMFQSICKRASQHSSAADLQVLEVIDFYETKMARLLDELRSVKGESEEVSDQQQMKMMSSNVTPSFKSITEAYQQQQKESKTHIQKLKREVESLKQELKIRPTPDEVKFYKHKLCHLEGLNRLNNTRLPTEDKTTQISEDITDQTREAGVGLAGFQILLPTLEVWAQQLHLLKELQRGLNTLTVRLMPWQLSDHGHNSAEAVKVEDMMLLVDSMLENTSTDDEKILRSPTRYTLGSMVSHFQKLFDVTSLSGVYPRMNEVYTKLGEVTNAMRNLRDVLDLDASVPPAEVVNQVARLVSSNKNSGAFHNMLGDSDIDSIIVKVKEHEEFFPAFHALIIEILQILGVCRLHDIIPALKSLKQTVQ